jgi:hypothetical protein
MVDIYERDGWTCVCGNSVFQYGTPQIAHRIPQRKHLIRKYGKEIIHHPVNLRATCCLKCNASVSTLNYKEVLEEILEYAIEHGETKIIGRIKEVLHE